MVPLQRNMVVVLSMPYLEGCAMCEKTQMLRPVSSHRCQYSAVRTALPVLWEMVEAG